MNGKTEVASSGRDTIKLVAAIVLLIAGIVAFYYYVDQSLLLRVLGLLATVGIALAVALRTVLGSRVWEFVADSRVEVRKVVWPTRQEALQTTLVVFLMVVLMGIILWGVDLLLVNIVRLVTG
jgi:preprotein translocase subunit SecE